MPIFIENLGDPGENITIIAKDLQQGDKGKLKITLIDE